ncbi:MAG: glycosyltransferase [Candidatus Paceibacterota bacterium]
MKVLITGEKRENGLTNTFKKAFESLGCNPVVFAEENLYRRLFPFLKNKYTNRIFWRFFVLPLQKEFIDFVKKEKPELILVLKGWFFRPKTLLAIKKELPQTKIFCFNPDNPFNTWHFGASNAWMRKSIPLYDVYFIWGKFLIERIKESGAKIVEYLPFGYDSGLHYPVKISENEQEEYGSDVAFIGSRDEEREKWLSYILDYDLKIWGSAWQKADEKLRQKWQGREAVGEEFSKVCNSAKIILNVIRRQNASAHNMRTFEVPACGGFLLSVRTDEAKNFFEEDKEAAYFSTPEGLKEKIDFYLKNDGSRKKIAEAGYERLLDSGYAYADRAKKIIEVYKSL